MSQVHLRPPVCCQSPPKLHQHRACVCLIDNSSKCEEVKVFQAGNCLTFFFDSKHFYWTQARLISKVKPFPGTSALKKDGTIKLGFFFLLVYSFMTFSTCIDLGNYHHNQDKEQSHHPKCPRVLSLYNYSLSSANPDLFSVSIVLVFKNVIQTESYSG